MPHALLTFHHPWSPSKSDRLLSLLSSPTSSTTSSSSTLSLPSRRPKAPSHQLSTHPATKTSSTTDGSVPLLILQLTIINPSSSSRSPTQQQPNNPNKAQQIADESLTFHPSETTAWAVTGGFMSRKPRESGGKGVVVMVARFTSKEGRQAREGLVLGLSKFADWVKHNEPATYSYAVLVPSGEEGGAKREVVMFERYRDVKAIAEHGARKEFKAMFKGILPFIEKEKTVMAEWVELEGSFVGETGEGQGEGGGRRGAKL